jgi:hypothetical protein
MGPVFGGGSPVTGQIILFDDRGQRMQVKSVQPNERTYEFGFEAEPKKPYYFKFQAARGTGRYDVQAHVKAADPCAMCLAEERCIEGHCVPPGECYPPCEDDMKCIDGECREECGRGEKWRDGRCVRVRRGCHPRCGKGERCRRGRCVPKRKKRKFITGKILSAWPTGSGITMLINRGTNDGVKKGAGGKVVGGKPLKIKSVFPKQCQAYTGMTKAELGNKKLVTIRL